MFSGFKYSVHDYFPYTEIKMRFIQEKHVLALCLLLALNIVPPNIYFYPGLQSSRAKDSSHLKWISASIKLFARTDGSTGPGNKCNFMFIRQACLNIQEQRESVRVYLGLQRERERETLFGLSNVFISVRRWYSDRRGGTKQKTLHTVNLSRERGNIM